MARPISHGCLRLAGILSKFPPNPRVADLAPPVSTGKSFIPKWDSFAMMAPLSTFILFPQVVAMQILYVIAMLAVFVLCVALLSTARRILRSSPLASGQLALSSIQDDISWSDDDDLVEIRPVATRMSSLRASEDDWNSDSDIDELPVADEIELPELVTAQTAQIETEPIVLGQTMSSSTVAVQETSNISAAEEPQTHRFRKPSRKTYNYALECLLLGVSAWVLIQTQRSNMQQRMPHSSRDRVA